MDEVVIDASLALNFLIPQHPYYQQTRRFFVDYAAYELIAPALYEAEADSNLLKMIVINNFSSSAATAARTLLRQLPVTIKYNSQIREIAWDIAETIGVRKIYDSTYAALAQFYHCEFWTADKKFHHAAHNQLPFVRFIGDYK